MNIAVLLDGGALPTEAVSKLLTVLPIGGTVATGSVCILATELTIGGTATVGNTCVLVPASTGWMTAGTGFLIDVLPSPVCSKACDRAVVGAAILTAVVTGLARDTVGLGKPGNDDRGADNLGKGCAAAGKMVDEHLACVAAPAADLTGARAEPKGGALVTTWESRAGTLPNLGGGETRVGVPTGGDAKCPACPAGKLGRADTFVLLGNNDEPRPGVTACWTGVTMGVVASNEGPTAGAHATKGELAAGTPDNVAGDWGKTGACGATVA